MASTPACPACGKPLKAHGTTLACRSCGGSFVETGEVLGQVRAASGDPMFEIESRIQPSRINLQRCPRCAAWMRMFTLDGITLDRCTDHGIWFDGDELERLLQLHAREPRRASRPLRALLEQVYLDELARQIGVPLTAHGKHAVLAERGVTVVIDPRQGRVTVELAELADVDLVVRLGTGALHADAEVGDPVFDRNWVVLTPSPELAPVVLSPAVRAELEVSRRIDASVGPSVTVRSGVASIELGGPARVPALTRAVAIARSLVQRLAEIHDELAAIVTAFGGRRQSGPWSWRTGYAAILPHDDISAVLRISTDRRDRLATTLGFERAAQLPWTLLARRTLYTAAEPWRTAALKGYVQGGAELDVRPEQVAAANPDWIELGERCELGWLGWPPPLATLRAALELGGALVGSGPSSGPYR